MSVVGNVLAEHILLVHIGRKKLQGNDNVTKPTGRTRFRT